MANLVGHVTEPMVGQLMAKQGAGHTKTYADLDSVLSEGQLRQCRDALIKLLPMVDKQRQAADAFAPPLAPHFSPAADGNTFKNRLDTHAAALTEGLVWFVIRAVHSAAANEYFPDWAPGAAAATAAAGGVVAPADTSAATAAAGGSAPEFPAVPTATPGASADTVMADAAAPVASFGCMSGPIPVEVSTAGGAPGSGGSAATGEDSTGKVKTWQQAKLRVYFEEDEEDLEELKDEEPLLSKLKDSDLEQLQEHVLATMREWSKWCGVTFVEAKKPRQSDIRITFTGLGAGWSAIGTDSTLPPFKAPNASMNLRRVAEVFAGSTDYGHDFNEWLARDVLHETGHALGLIHEHQSPDSSGKIPWNRERVIEHFQKAALTRETAARGPITNQTVHAGILAAAEEDARRQILDVDAVSNYSNYDPDSIMHYPFKKHEVTDQSLVSDHWNNKLSDLDKKWAEENYGPASAGDGAGAAGADPTGSSAAAAAAAGAGSSQSGESASGGAGAGGDTPATASTGGGAGAGAAGGEPTLMSYADRKAAAKKTQGGRLYLAGRSLSRGLHLIPTDLTQIQRMLAVFAGKSGTELASVHIKIRDAAKEVEDARMNTAGEKDAMLRFTANPVTATHAELESLMKAVPVVISWWYAYVASPASPELLRMVGGQTNADKLEDAYADQLTDADY